jgi:hypothetical protein
MPAERSENLKAALREGFKRIDAQYDAALADWLGGADPDDLNDPAATAAFVKELNDGGDEGEGESGDDT